MPLPQLVREIARFDTDFLFAELCPRLLQRSAGGTGASILLVVDGVPRTVDLAARTLFDGERGECRLRLELGGGDLTAVLSGKAATADSLGRLQFALRGDVLLLRQFIAALTEISGAEAGKVLDTKPFTSSNVPRQAPRLLRGTSGAVLRSKPPPTRPVADAIESGSKAGLAPMAADGPAKATDRVQFAATNLATWLRYLARVAGDVGGIADNQVQLALADGQVTVGERDLGPLAELL